ncbi:MAG: hypothetical protein R3F24_14450 [Gammaproteobacteria bacterium]
MANSPFAMMVMTPGSNGAAFQYRTSIRAPRRQWQQRWVSTLPRWCAWFASATHSAATSRPTAPRGRYVTQSSDVRHITVGLAVTSHSDGNLATAVFDNVSLVLPTPDTTAPSVPQNLAGTTVGTSRVDLSWSAATDTGGSGLAGYRVYRNVGNSTPLASEQHRLLGHGLKPQHHLHLQSERLRRSRQ